jgi:hypothetical protein
MATFDRREARVFGSVALSALMFLTIDGHAQPVQTGLPSGWIHTPGAIVRADCVHGIPKGALLDEATGDVTVDGQLFAHFDKCPDAPVVLPGSTSGAVPSYSGFVEYLVDNVTNLPSGSNINALVSQWLVPPFPTSQQGQTIFLFNGLEPSSQNVILQPVLQWGPSVAGGGDSWAIASWLVNSGGVYYSPLEGVNAGDTISGQTSFTQSGSTLHWTILIQDTSSGAWSSLGVTSTGYQWTLALPAALEADNVSTCANFPYTSDVVPAVGTTNFGAWFFGISMSNNGGVSFPPINNGGPVPQGAPSCDYFIEDNDCPYGCSPGTYYGGGQAGWVLGY